MRRYAYLFVALLLVTSFACFGSEQVKTFSNIVDYSFSQERGSETIEPFIVNLALPSTKAELNIVDSEITTYNERGEVVSTRNADALDFVEITKSYQMRELFGFSVKVNPRKQLRNGYQVLNNVNFELIGTDQIETPTEISEAFVNVYKNMAKNYADSYLANLPLAQPKMLILSCSSDLNVYINNFVKWKKSMGFAVDILTKNSSWANSIAVKEVVRDYYESNKPDYVLIIGDSDGSFSVPTNMFTSPDGQENDADDNYYSMLEGDDYFPELLIGRFSILGISSLLSQISKSIKYEKTGFMQNEEWHNRALVVAGNYAEGGLQPSTPVRMSRWVREKFLEHNYAQVDTLYYPGVWPGTSALQSHINNGVQYISYRGWGDATGWHYPQLHIADIETTTNINMPPIVYSIVCNTGDFANANANPNFGERWMQLGSAATTKGCVAFVGPSDLHTKTKFNNALSTGIFGSFLIGNERTFAATVLHGKVELYNNYPLINHLPTSSGNYVEFYYHVYNILSDPSLKMWVNTPREITNVSGINSTLPKSQNFIEVTVPSALNGAIITATKDNENYTYCRVIDGSAIVPINVQDNGETVKIQINKENYIPYVRTIDLVESQTIGITNILVDDNQLLPGHSSTISINMKNYGDDCSNVTATLSSPNAGITVPNPEFVIDNLSSNASVSHDFEVNVSGDVTLYEVAEFALSFDSHGNNTEKFSLALGGAFLTFNECTKSGDEYTFSFKNVGNQELASGDVRVYAMHSCVSNNDQTVTYNSAAVNSNVDVVATIQTQADATPGTLVPFRFEFTESASGYTVTQYAAVEVGEVSENDPTGPDKYGYYAYGSNDTNYSQAPTYDWQDINPLNGGDGDSEVVGDDDSFVKQLPFTFKYYGHDYDTITMCSNGWMSFGSNQYVNFTNQNIPSYLGPESQLCPNWDDLKGLQTSEDVFADMHIITKHDAANNRFIIEWDNTYSQSTIDAFENAELQKFQVILEPKDDDNGDITFQYHTFTNPSVNSNYATIGIVNKERTDGIRYSFANIHHTSAKPVENNFAIKFTTTPPDNYVGNDNNVEIINTSLNQNYPNPFNPETTISYSVGRNNRSNSEVELNVYNVKGQRVKTLVDQKQIAGNYNVIWNGTDNSNNKVASGVYYYKLKVDNKSLTKKMIMLK